MVRAISKIDCYYVINQVVYKLDFFILMKELIKTGNNC